MTLANIDLRLLRVFRTVVETGGFTQAAAALNVGRSTISTHMADLEGRLDMRLCMRGRSGFALTARGEQVHERIIALFKSLEDFEADMQSIHGRLTGDLTIGLIDYMTSVPEFAIGEVIRDFVVRAPDVTINLKVMPEEEVVRAMLDGRLHMGVLPVGDRVTGLDYHDFLEEHLCLYCADGHTLFGIADAGITPEMLKSERVAGHHADQVHGEMPPDPDVRHAAANNLEAILILILTGRYVGYLPTHFAEAWVRAGRLRTLAPQTFSYDNDLMMVTRAGTQLSSPLEAFLALMRERHSGP